MTAPEAPVTEPSGQTPEAPVPAQPKTMDKPGTVVMTDNSGVTHTFVQRIDEDASALWARVRETMVRFGHLIHL